MKNMNSSFAEYAADSRNPRRIALGGGDRGIKTVLGRIVERLRSLPVETAVSAGIFVRISIRKFVNRKRIQYLWIGV